MSSPGHGTLDTSILEMEEELLGLECNSDVAENRFQHIDASFAVIDLFNHSVQDDFDTNQSLQNGAERDDRDAERQLKVDDRAKEDLRKETEELCTSFELLHSTANSVTAVDKNDIEATLLKLDARLDNLGKDNTSLMDATEAAKQRLASLNAQLMTKRKANGDLRSQLDEKNDKRARLHIKQQQRSANAQMLREQLQSAERADADLKNRKLAVTNFIETLNSNEAQSVAAVAAHEAQLHVMRDELTLVREKTSSVNEEVVELQMSLESTRSSLQQQKALIEEVADKLRTQALNADDTSSGADALERLEETRKQKEQELGKIVAEVPVQRQVLEELTAKKNNQKEADWTLRALEEDLAATARKKEQMELEENLRVEKERLEKERQKLDEERAEWAQREAQLNKELEEKQKAAAAEEYRAEEERRRRSEEQQRWEESQRQQKQAKTTREEERLKDNSPGPSRRSGDKKPASKRTSAQMDSSLDEDVGSSRSSDEDFSLGKTSRQSRPVFKKPAQTKPAAKRGRPPLAKKIDSAGLKPALSSTPQVSQSTPVRGKGPCAMGLPQATASRSATPSPILRLGIDVPRHSTPLPDHRPVADHFTTPARQTPRPATTNAQPGGIPVPGAPARGRPPVMPSSSAPSRAPAPSSSATGQSRSTMESTSARTDPSPQQDAASPLANFLLDDPSNVTSDPDEEQSHFWE